MYMNRNLLFSLVAAVTIVFSSCRPNVDVPNNYVELAGRWRLQSIERRGAFGWETLYSDYQQGYFYFYSNGTIDYRDSYGIMRGRWYQQGGFTVNSHFSLDLDLQSSNSSDHINWRFDDCFFSNNYQFTARYQTASYDYEYGFIRQ
jgi:hypothetical protein